MDRRELVKALGAGASLPILTGGADLPDAAIPNSPPQGPAWIGPAGTPSDPDLLRPKVPWPKLLTTNELATLAALCDTIIPADDRSPAASQVGATDYLNEYLSAPYPSHRDALIRVRGGLVWLDVESARRFGKSFAGLASTARTNICDDICFEPEAKPDLKAAARFFDEVRGLTATAFYTTREGMKDLSFVGNVPAQRWDGPPPEVLRHLGLL